MNAVKLFESRQIRSVWNQQDNKWYFAVADVVEALTDSVNVKDYIKKMRKRDSELNSNWGTMCPPLEILAPDGKKRKTQCANAEGLLRIIQSIPSPKAEPFKRWLARVGYERLEEIENPELAAKGSEITVSRKEREDYISLTDSARYKNPSEPIDIIKNWLRSRTTIEFIGLWEQLHNPDFKAVEFDRFMYEAGSNSFVISPGKWIETTNAIGITTKSGRYGGTFAHQDIAFKFASWVSAEFKLYLLKEFQRLKQDEFDQKKLEWSVSRTIAKVNYLIHTDANADEADLQNMALFGQTALAWKTEHPELQGNMRDYATLEQWSSSLSGKL